MAPTINAARNKPKGPQPVISRITIRGTDIFDMESNVALKKFPYNTINFLHIRTQEHVIRQELLFKIGDRFDPFLVDETERNLRALSFIRAARVAKFPQRDGTVALVVHVNDSWTTEPQINLGGQNKIDSTEVGFKEKNLFGLGKTVGIFYKKSDDSIEREYSYTDPRLMGSRWRLSGGVTSMTEGRERNVLLERPFYSADTKWSARTSYDYTEAILDEFVENQLVSSYEQTKEVSQAYVGTKVGGGRDIVNHAGLRYRRILTDYERIDRTALLRDIPPDDRQQTVFLDIDTSRVDFIKTTHLEKMTRVEDVNLGPSLVVSPGISPERLNGTKDQYEAEGSFERKSLFKGKHLFNRKYTYSGRGPLSDGENQRYGITWKYYHRNNESNTLVLHTRADWGDELDPDNQVKLGGDNGLRAFEVDGIVGNKGWVFNAEDRLFFIDELFNLVSVGGAVFYDTGYVWAKEDPVSLSKLRSSVGAGLRLGLTRSSNEVIIHVDLSYRTQVDEPGDSHLVVTFGTGQAF